LVWCGRDGWVEGDPQVSDTEDHRDLDAFSKLGVWGERRQLCSKMPMNPPRGDGASASHLEGLESGQGVWQRWEFESHPTSSAISATGLCEEGLCCPVSPLPATRGVIIWI
jgi:hypothetical protein